MALIMSRLNTRLSDNGPSYIASELAEYLEENGMSHTRGRPYHPQIQGNIERWHRSLENYCLLGKLESTSCRFIDYYNYERYHESLENLTPADVYYGRAQAVLDRREQIKLDTSAMRRRMHYDRQIQLQTLVS